MKTSNKVFEQLIEKPQATKKWLFFPLSFIFHFCLAAAVIFGPMMNADDRMPEVKTVTVVLVSPPAVATPPPPPPAKGSHRAGKRKKPKTGEKRKPPAPGRLLQPIDIPEDIEDEGFEFGIGDGDPNGVDGGVIGGTPGGVLGSEFLGTDLDPAASITPMNVQQPVLIRRVEPVYPMEALKIHLQGTVILNAVTDIYGRVVKVDVIHGSPILRNSAIQAVRQWVYEPYIVNGVPKPVTFMVKINFSLQR